MEGPKTTTTLYISNFVYQNDTLQFIGHEEGRARWAFHKYLNGTTQYKFEYDYFLKDHLGNTRMVLTQQKDTTQYIATMEAAYRATETQLFYNIPPSNYSRAAVSGYPADGTTSPNDSLMKLSGSGQKLGAAIVLKVMSGDVVDIAVKSFYKSGGTANSPNSSLTDVLSSFANGMVATAAGAKGSLTDLNNQTTSPLFSAINSFNTGNITTPAGKPKAYLNWILLDEQLQYVNTYPQSGAIQAGSADVLNTLGYSGINITKNGYLYIYVTNETPGWDAFFDNLAVKHYTGPILEETHYYPFGLTIAGISSKALKSNYVENKKKFQGQEFATKEFSDGSGLDMYEFKWRMDDPQTGRFWQIDPLANDYVYNSTYAFSENKVVAHIELEGLESLALNPSWLNLALESNNIVTRGGTLTENLVKTSAETTNKASSKGFSQETLQNFSRGRATEAEQLAKNGLEKNNQPIEVVDPKTGKSGTTIADAMKNGGKSTTEIKDVSKQSLTKQLRLQEKFSNENGFNPELIINNGAKLSKPLQNSTFEIKTYNMGIKVDNTSTKPLFNPAMSNPAAPKAKPVSWAAQVVPV